MTFDGLPCKVAARFCIIFVSHLTQGGQCNIVAGVMLGILMVDSIRGGTLYYNCITRTKIRAKRLRYIAVLCLYLVHNL